MKQLKLGKTEIVVEKNGMGCLPIQRIPKEDAVRLLRKAYDGGIRFFDTARDYTDSEEKLGEAFSGMRQNVYIATKSHALTADKLRVDIDRSLQALRTDYIDIFQTHNPPFCPKPGQENGLYEVLLEAKKAGKIRHISISNHNLGVAEEAVKSGLYETLQFPFSYLASPREFELVELCRQHDMGFIAMKAMAGGVIRDGFTAAAFMEQQENVLPIWGAQRENELDQFLLCIREGVELTKERQETIERDRIELAGDFCRGCGYCMPCPMEIKINSCARMSLMLRRAPTQKWLSEKWQEEMRKIESCLNCRSCVKKCPYGLSIPELLKKNYEDYFDMLAAQSHENSCNGSTRKA